VTIAMTHALALLECYRTALEAEAETTPGTICLRHGEEVFPSLGTRVDECCSGIAWVRIVSVEGLRTREDVAARCLRTERVITLEMGIARCLSFGTIQAPITCDQWTEIALQQDLDHDAMEAALCCAFPELSADNFFPVRAGTYEPTGPDGNCIGATMQVILEADCGCTS